MFREYMRIMLRYIGLLFKVYLAVAITAGAVVFLIVLTITRPSAGVSFVAGMLFASGAKSNWFRQLWTYLRDSLHGAHAFPRHQ
jgi:hypothetical protein